MKNRARFLSRPAGRHGWSAVVQALALLLPAAVLAATPADRELAARLMTDYDRNSSQLVVRVVDSPTRAALDHAAYHQNALLTPSGDPKPGPGNLQALSFGGLLENVADDPAAPDTSPMAVEPMLDALAAWNYDASAPLLNAIAEIEAEAWAGESPIGPQRVAAAWLDGETLRLRLEFAPETTLPAGVSDGDGDGWAEVVGTLRAGVLASEAAAFLRDEYLAAPLSLDELEVYFAELAGHWYPRYRTVLLPTEEIVVWPNDRTEAAIRQLCGDASFAQPTAVLRSEPVEGRPIYHVFLVGAATDQRTLGVIETADNAARWRSELAEWGGGEWANWAAKLASFRDDLRAQLAARPAELTGLVGADGWLFFRGSLEYLLADDLRDQPEGRDPFPAIVDYREQLAAKGVDLLLVILPSKPEVYPEKISGQAPAGSAPYVQPYTRKLLLELADAGVEAVDLLPAFVAAKAEAELYLPHDTHWTPAGAELAAGLIAARVRRYDWFAGTVPEPIAYGTREASFTRIGDIVPMLAPKEKAQVRPMELTARQVTLPDGTLYEDDPASPIVMLGDSFCGIYQFEDCGHAGLSAQVAKELGTPLDLLMANGSGPKIRVQLARRGKEAVSGKKLVIWTVVARDLYRYWAPWDKVKVP